MDDFGIISYEEAAESVENTQFESIQELQAWLQPTEYLSPGNEYEKHRRAYVPNTGDWLRSADEFRQWHSSSNVSCLWVKGVPGSGKSVFAASTANKLMDEGVPVLFFFFRQIVATNHDPKYLVRDWLSQLLPHSRILQLRLNNVASAVDGIELTQLWSIFRETIQSIPRLYCIADALDEMDDNHDDFIANLASIGAMKPGSIKVMLTSRPIPRIEAILRSPEVIAVKLDPTLTYPDITRYVETHLATLDPTLRPETEDKVRTAICGHAKGLFLHARLMTDNLTEGLARGKITEESLPESLERLPKNLKELYTSMLSEHSKRSGVSQEQQFIILQCVAHSSRPLRLIELGSLIARHHGDASLQDGKELVKASCGRLLEILEDESISVIHHSFTEFLRDPTRKEDGGAFPVLDSGAAHQMLCILCLQYLDSITLPDSMEDLNEIDYYEEYDYGDSRIAKAERTRDNIVRKLNLSSPLIEYAVGNFSYHALKQDQGNTTLFEALDTYLAQGKPALKIWSFIKGWSRFPMDLNSIHIATILNLEGYIRHIATTGTCTDIDIRDARGNSALTYASQEGCHQIAKVLLEHGANPHSEDNAGSTPLHYATEKKNYDIVKLLLARGANPLAGKTKNSIDNEFGDSDLGETPFQYACCQGSVDTIKDFLPFVETVDLYRALHWTVYSNNSEAVQVILQTGRVPVDILTADSTALFKAAQRRDPKMIGLLLEYGANPNYGCVVEYIGGSSTHNPKIALDYNIEDTRATAIHSFSGYRDYRSSLSGSTNKQNLENCLKLLLGAGADIQARMRNEHSVLHISCEPTFDHGWYITETKELMTEVLAAAGADPNAQTSDGISPLHLASTPQLAEILIQGGAEIDQKDRRGQTPLFRAVGEGKWIRNSSDLVYTLLNYEANIHTTNNSGSTILHQAFLSLNEEVRTDESIKLESIEKLFQIFVQSGLDLNKRDNEGVPAVMLFKGEKRLLSSLVQAGLNLDATDAEGETALVKAMSNYSLNLETVKNLVNRGCSVMVRDKSGASLLHLAITSRDPSDIIQYLINSGVNPLWVDNEGNTLMHKLASYGESYWPARFKALLDLGVSPDSMNAHGETPLHLACGVIDFQIHDSKAFLDLFLDGKYTPKANVNALNHNGASPLHYAATISEYYTRRLLKAGADPTIVTHQGLTPLHIAARAHQSNIVGILISEYTKSGVLSEFINRTVTAGQHRTALHYACRSGRPESVSYLLSNGADPMSVDANGLTPLHATAELGSYRGDRSATGNHSLLILPDEPINLNGINKPSKADYGTGRTTDIVEMLIRAGADMNARSNEPGLLSPIDVAIKMGCIEMVEDLRRRGVIELADQQEDSKVTTITSTGSGLVDIEKLQSNFREVLQLRNPELFEKFVSSGVDIMEPATQWRDDTGLHILVEWGYVPLLERYINEAARIDHAPWMTEENNPGTLLCHACEVDPPRLDVIRFLVERVKVNVNAISDRRGYTYSMEKATALHWLSKGRHFWHIEAVEYLIKMGADLEAKNAEGETPLMVAVAETWPGGIWREDTVRVLLSNGANPNATDKFGNSYLCNVNDQNIVRLLQQHGADIPRHGQNAIISAVASLNIDAVAAFLEAGASPNAMMTSRRYALHEVARLNENYHSTPEDNAIREQLTELLLENGADPFLTYEGHDYRRDGYGGDPNDEEEDVDDDEEEDDVDDDEEEDDVDDDDEGGHNKKTDKKSNSIDGKTVIQSVIEEHGYLEPFWRFPNLELENRGQGGRTLLLSACYPAVPPYQENYDGTPKPPATANPAAAIALLKQGADPDAVDSTGRTSLHWLCSTPNELDDAHKEAFTTLVKRAPNLVHVRDHAGATPLHIATQCTQEWAIKQLISSGADPNLYDNEGNTVLHYLARLVCGKKARAEQAALCMKYFLSLGVPIDQRNSRGETALFTFMSKSWRVPDENKEKAIFHHDALALFTDAYADLFVRNNKDETLLHAIASIRVPSGWYESKPQAEDMLAAFKKLMAKGLDPRAEDSKMRTAIDVAVASGNHFIVELFRVKDEQKV